MQRSTLFLSKQAFEPSPGELGVILHLEQLRYEQSLKLALRTRRKGFSGEHQAGQDEDIIPSSRPPIILLLRARIVKWPEARSLRAGYPQRLRNCRSREEIQPKAEFPWFLGL